MRDDGEVVLYRLAEHRRVWERGVAVPRVLGYTPSSEPVGDRLLIVSEYLAGQDGEDASRAFAGERTGRRGALRWHDPI